MAATFSQAAFRLGVELESADGSEVVSGHSLRVTGAQGLARLGLDTWAIQLIGRWGSATILRYIRLVPLERAVAWAADAARRRELPQIISEAATKSTKSSAGVAKVVQAASCQTPDEWVPTVLALTEPHKDEVLMAAPVPEVLVWIRNPEKHASRGLFHLADGPVTGVPIGALRTRCSWRYGGNRAVIIGSAPPRPHDCKQVCTKCAPEVRATLEKAFKEAVSEFA